MIAVAISFYLNMLLQNPVLKTNDFLGVAFGNRRE
jgi:hypothetical protein